MAANQNQVRPIVFVGLGSTGAKIVSRLKELIGREQDPWTAAFCRYIRITSEISQEVGVDPNLPHILLATEGLTPRATVEAFSLNNDEGLKHEFDEWWPRNPVDAKKPWIPSGSTVETGAGGQRPLGRLLLHHKSLGTNLATTLQSLHAEIQAAREALPVQERARVDANAVDCYVFGLLAGGTCSGTLIDLAYLIKAGLPVQYLMGVFLLGDVCIEDVKQPERQPFKTRMQDENTQYAVAELMLAQSPTGRAIIEEGWVQRIGGTSLNQTIFDNSPYHRVTLVGAKNQQGHPLEKFDDYMQFIVQYYGGMFASGTHATQIGRQVDQQAQQAGFVEQQYPARASTFQRIGLLDLRVPKEKILALASNQMAKHIGTDHFNNVDRVRLQAALERFQVRITWGAFQNRFEPDLDQMAEQQLQPLPQEREEFRRLTEQRKKDLETYYGAWRSGAAPEAKQRLAGFEKAWQEAVAELLQNTLGQNAQGFRMGELSALLNDLSGSISNMDDELTRDINTFETAISGADGLEQKVKDEIADMTKTLPEGLMGKLGRMGWRGEDDVNERMVRYRNALRSLATKTLAKQALDSLRTEVEALSVARKLVGHEVALKLFQKLQQTADKAFTAESMRSGNRQDVISAKEDIQACFVDRILDEVTGNSGGAPCRQVLADKILTGWKSDTGIDIFDSFRALIGLLRGRKDLQNADLAMERSADVKRVVQGLSLGLRRSFSESMDSVVGTAVEEISIWEAIRIYVSRVASVDDPNAAEAVLKDLFTEYMRCAQPFARLSTAGARDRFPMVKDMYYVCDTDDARKCFEELGIDSPGDFLGRLLNFALGEMPTPMTGTRSVRHELLLFIGIQGELPVYYEGYEGIAGLLKQASATQAGTITSWSDSRFPAWIEKWRSGTPAPPLP